MKLGIFFSFFLFKTGDADFASDAQGVLRVMRQTMADMNALQRCAERAYAPDETIEDQKQCLVIFARLTPKTKRTRPRPPGCRRFNRLAC